MAKTENLAEIVKKAREQRGLTQTQLAKNAHVQPFIIAAINYGRFTSYKNRTRVLDYLGIKEGRAIITTNGEIDHVVLNYYYPLVMRLVRELLHLNFLVENYNSEKALEGLLNMDEVAFKSVFPTRLKAHEQLKQLKQYLQEERCNKQER